MDRPSLGRVSLLLAGTMRYAAALLLFACGCAASQDAIKKSPPIEVFDSAATLKVELRLPFADFLPEYEGGDDAVIAQLSMPRPGPAAGPIPVQLVRIGHSSAWLCEHPKMLLISPPGAEHIAALPAAHTAFLVPECNDAETAARTLAGPEQLHAQRLAYQLLGRLKVPTVLVRPTQIRLADSAGADTLEMAGFFVEHVRNLALRATGRLDGYTGVGEIRGVARHAELDPMVAARVHMFQILINNRDWQLMEFAPISRRFHPLPRAVSLHNMFVLLPDGARPIPVALDFDLSSFVGVPPALVTLTGDNGEIALAELAQPEFLPDADWLLRWMVLGLSDLRRVYPDDAVQAARRFFLDERAVLTEVASAKSVLPAIQARANAHLNAFYIALEAHFDIPWVGASTALYDQPGGSAVCPELVAGLPVEVIDQQGEWSQVRLLQKIGFVDYQAHPLCADGSPAAAQGWIKSSALSSSRRN